MTPPGGAGDPQVILNDQCVVDVSGAGCPAASMSSPQSAGGKTLPGPQGAPWLAGAWGRQLAAASNAGFLKRFIWFYNGFI